MDIGIGIGTDMPISVLSFIGKNAIKLTDKNDNISELTIILCLVKSHS